VRLLDARSLSVANSVTWFEDLANGNRPTSTVMRHPTDGACGSSVMA
jgi:hypothetical protein